MDGANAEVKEEIKVALKKYKLGSLLKNTVIGMSWNQLSDFKSVGSLDITKKILQLIDQNKAREITRFWRAAIGVMHFSEVEIQGLPSDLTDDKYVVT